ncbi:hypothetical protein BJY00DRAFT_320122 [Aspergillus carlsbadensis]|nr:hypothetical protein BJY00DRAFT_320122 [Aspergillus carlsbadensis]
MASVFTTTRTSSSIQLAETRLNTRDELGLAGLFQEQVSSCSLATAIEDDAYSLSYADLHSKAARLAEQVDALAELKQNPVGILIPRGINHVLAQLAILFSGRACVPLDDKLSDDCLRDMLGNLGSTFVTTDSENAHRLTGFTHLLVEHTTVEKTHPSQLGSAVPGFNSPNRCSHIFHTSGTTGKPKAVELLAGGLINLCRDPDAGFIKPGQRVGHAASVVFDISLVEIWGSLLNGATIVVIPLQCVLDPLELSRFIKDKGLDVVQLTTALLDITAYACPWAFSSLDTLITGGEAMNCQSVRSIFEAGAPHRIINAYGPTECSVYCTWHCVSRSEAEKGCIPVGKPIRNVEAFLVDEHFEPVGQSKAGELLVAGAGLAGGYIGEKEKTAKSFICLPRQCRPGGQTVAPTRVYRTGDLMRRDETGHYCYIGRIDNQVKIDGKRVELETIESILQETGLVSAATVIKVSPREAGRGSFLVAFCIPTSADITTGTIATSYIDLNPRLLVPRIELTGLLPLKNNGKVDRARLERQYTKGIESSLMRIIPSGKQEDHIRAQLGYIWVDVLGLPGKNVLPTDDFIAMGGSSLTVATLIARINHAFGISLRASMLYERMTLDSLAKLLAALQLGNTASPSVQVDEEEAWLQDSTLGHDLRPLHDDSVLDWETAYEGRVFMTGATGFVGAFLLARLLEQLHHMCRMRHTISTSVADA